MQSLSRNDLNNKEETWSEAALAGGDFSKYANLFADDEFDKNLSPAGLAHDREIRSGAREGPREGSARRDMGQLPPPVQRPSSVDSTSTNGTGPFIATPGCGVPARPEMMFRPCPRQLSSGHGLCPEQ